MATVCVTGGSGFIASFLVKQLLEKGYTVHATVRSVSNTDKTAPLTSLPGAKERLKLFEADLLKGESFLPALEGCVGVFHTASPFVTDYPNLDPEKDLIQPAVEGTRAVLNAVHKTPSVKRVVLTSSFAAIGVRKNAPTDVYNEDLWSDEEMMRNAGIWYPLSKTLAEREAWKLAKQYNIDLRVINPVLVLGPLITSHLNQSHEYILKYLNGTTKTIPNSTMGLVHVKDVVDAHIAAYEKDEASGRYLLISSLPNWEEIVNNLRELYPEHATTLPTEVAIQAGQEKAKGNPFSNAKVTALLGRQLIGTKDMLRETAEALKQFGHL